MVSSNNHTHCGNNVRILPGSGAPEIWMEILIPTPSLGEPNPVFKLVSPLTTIIDVNMAKTLTCVKLFESAIFKKISIIFQYNLSLASTLKKFFFLFSYLFLPNKICSKKN